MQCNNWRLPPPELELGQNHLHIWLVELDLPADELRRARTILAPDELARADRFHFERDNRRFVAAHAALRSILARYLLLQPDALRFEQSPYGKPSLVRGLSNALPDLSFNLSHSGEFALIAVVRGCRVGIDIERIRPELAAGEIAERYFSPVELHQLRGLPASEQTRGFFRCWTRKEAFVKARGEGLSIPLASFDVVVRPERMPALLRIEGDPGELDRWALYAVNLADRTEYEAAAVVERSESEICHWLF